MSEESKTKKAVEMSKTVITIWLTITIALLGIAISWGMMQATVDDNSKSIDQFHKVLYGVDGVSGLVNSLGIMQSDIAWIRKALEDQKKESNKNE
ncbi:MAG: hypothetical protein ACXAC7_08015 [Candidatus Hodarchaeales archaeon]